MSIKKYIVLFIFFIVHNNGLISQYPEFVDLDHDIIHVQEIPNDSHTDDCLDVLKIVENCHIVWLNVNIHFFLDDKCEGEISIGDKQWCFDNKPAYLPGCDFSVDNVHFLAESLINRANEFAENMSDNLPWGNEMINIGMEPEDAIAQCMPIRFLLNDVHVHCNSNAQYIYSSLPQFYVNPSSEINIIITNIKPAGGENPAGIGSPGGNGLVLGGLTWFAPSTLIHEFAHNCLINHPWKEDPEFSDTWNSTWSWDHDCNPNSPDISANSCWDILSGVQCIPNCSPDNTHYTEHPCCGWENQTTNIMTYSGWATNGDYSTISRQQLTGMLNYINHKFCNKVVVVNPACPPPSANIIIPPLEETDNDCDFCMNFGASMHEVEYNVSFFHMHNGTETMVRNTGWIKKQAGRYCISTRKIKLNSDLFPGGFIAGERYTVTLRVKNACGTETTKSKVFQLPDKNCQDIPVIKVEAIPNPTGDFFRIQITSDRQVETASLFVNHPVNGVFMHQDINVLPQGTSEIDISANTWPQGLNIIHLIIAGNIYSTTIYKN